MNLVGIVGAGGVITLTPAGITGTTPEKNHIKYEQDRKD